VLDGHMMWSQFTHVVFSFSIGKSLEFSTVLLLLGRCPVKEPPHPLNPRAGSAAIERDLYLRGREESTHPAYLVRKTVVWVRLGLGWTLCKGNHSNCISHVFPYDCRVGPGFLPGLVGPEPERI
jgi:hypothetical protein